MKFAHPKFHRFDVSFRRAENAFGFTAFAPLARPEGRVSHSF